LWGKVITWLLKGGFWAKHTPACPDKSGQATPLFRGELTNATGRSRSRAFIVALAQAFTAAQCNALTPALSHGEREKAGVGTTPLRGEGGQAGARSREGGIFDMPCPSLWGKYMIGTGTASRATTRGMEICGRAGPHPSPLSRKAGPGRP